MDNAILHAPDPISDVAVTRERNARLAAVDAVWHRLTWHKDRLLSELDLDEQSPEAKALDEYVSRASNDVAELAVLTYGDRLQGADKCRMCGYVLINATDILSGLCCRHRIQREFDARGQR